MTASADRVFGRWTINSAPADAKKEWVKSRRDLHFPLSRCTMELS